MVCIAAEVIKLSPAHAKSAKVITEIQCSSILAADGMHNCGTEGLDRPSGVNCVRRPSNLSVQGLVTRLHFSGYTEAGWAGQFNLEHPGFPRNNAAFSARASKTRALVACRGSFANASCEALSRRHRLWHDGQCFKMAPGKPGLLGPPEVPRALGGKVLLSSSFIGWIESEQRLAGPRRTCINGHGIRVS